jgi:subtilase family serine protease
MYRSIIAAASALLVSNLALNAQTVGRHAVPLVHDAIDESRLYTLAGNTHPQANVETDRGAVADSFAMDHMLLELKRSAEQERAVEQAIQQMHNPQSPQFHSWMTAQQFGEKFGASAQDIDTVTEWLRSHGFTVNAVYPGGTMIDFSGTAAQVRRALHTEIHRLNVLGQPHISNISDPQIPAALAAAVRGVVSLNDFRPHTMKKVRRASPKFTFGSGDFATQALVPGDLATIYNLTPAFAAGYTGQGQTIAVIEDTDLYSTDDWNTFRAEFGLARYAAGSLTAVHPSGGAGNCQAPGVNPDDVEATLDAEWSSAAAPDAAILVAACASTEVTFGGTIAMVNLINATNPPNIVSISYGICEVENGESGNAAFTSIYQQAVAEGISVFVAAGDEGAASCDAGLSAASHGIGVSGFASTAYNVAVGGTDFGDSYANTNSTYWNTNNSAVYASALSYIPEIPWNDSCAGSLLALSFSYSTTFGATGFCGSFAALQNELLEVVAGSGGPSGCSSGGPAIPGVVSGGCGGVLKPDWQAGLTGVPEDGVRDIPDVSLFAGAGVWGHYYVFCYSDLSNGGALCTGDPSTWAGAGGTSFGAPIMAGVQALINQMMAGGQGNPNVVYYQLAASTGNVCDSSAGDTGQSACVFHNVTLGDIDVNCSGSTNCYGNSAPERGIGRHNNTADGVLSTSRSAYDPAYSTGPGWNFATGIGSVNVYNLLMNWKAAVTPAPSSQQ